MRRNKEYFLGSVIFYDNQQLQDAQGIGGYICVCMVCMVLYVWLCI